MKSQKKQNLFVLNRLPYSNWLAQICSFGSLVVIDTAHVLQEKQTYCSASQEWQWRRVLFKIVK